MNIKEKLQFLKLIPYKKERKEAEENGEEKFYDGREKLTIYEVASKFPDD